MVSNVGFLCLLLHFIVCLPSSSDLDSKMSFYLCPKPFEYVTPSLMSRGSHYAQFLILLFRPIALLI